jgi:hypothetical protein
MRAIAVLVAFLVVIAAAGCGSSGGSDTNSSAAGGSAESAEGSTGVSGARGASGTTGATSSGPLTKTEFVKEAEAICAKIPATYGKEVEALEAEAKKKGQKSTTSEQNLKAAVPADYAAVEELEALTPPKGEEQKVEAIVASLESAAKGLEAKPESPLTGPKSPYAEFQELTKAYGLKSCSQL